MVCTTIVAFARNDGDRARACTQLGRHRDGRHDCVKDVGRHPTCSRWYIHRAVDVGLDEDGDEDVGAGVRPHTVHCSRHSGPRNMDRRSTRLLLVRCNLGLHTDCELELAVDKAHVVKCSRRMMC